MKRYIGIFLIAATVLICLLSLQDRSEKYIKSFESSGVDGIFNSPALPEGTVRVNNADLDDLIQIPGIGETLGQALLDEKEAHGFFHFPEDLMSVRGIAERKLEQILPWLDLEEGE